MLVSNELAKMLNGAVEAYIKTGSQNFSGVAEENHQ
jgi:hypothetical protein